MSDTISQPSILFKKTKNIEKNRKMSYNNTNNV